MSPRTRIDFDADREPFAGLVHLAAEYQRAARTEDWPAAASAAHRIEHLAEQVTDDAMMRAIDTVSARQLAAGMGLVHGTVNHRLRRAQERTSAGDQAPAHLYLVHRRPDHLSDPEFLSLHRTREGAQNTADRYNERFGDEQQFRANVRRVSGDFQHEHPSAPTEIQE